MAASPSGSKGLDVSITVPGSNKPAVAGYLSFLDNRVASNSGTILLRATVDKNAGEALWPGQFVRVRLVLHIAKDAVLVPAEAVQIGQQGPFVYTVDHSDTAALVPITQGQRQGSNIVVESGVKPNDIVVLTGQMTLQPNAKVAIVPSGPANGGGAPGPTSPGR